MKIEQIDFFYLAMPQVHNIGDGSQDALLVRIQGGGYTGWGECETSPLVSIANWVCPMSHSASRTVRDAILGREINQPEDIFSFNREAKAIGMDIAQTDHTLSGVDIALWDWLGKVKGEPVFTLLGYKRTYPRIPYASALFGDTPQETLDKGRKYRGLNYRAVKFGWGPFGIGSVKDDEDQLAAAREGLGPDGILLVDAGTVWESNVNKAHKRSAALKRYQTEWLEEPFIGPAIDSYKELRDLSEVKLAGGEGAHNFYDAKHLIDHGRIDFIQIDAGRIGGLTTASKVAAYAMEKKVVYVNHTFTSQLALSASLQPYAGHPGELICEYPVELSELGRSITENRIDRDENGLVHIPEVPGLGMTIDADACKRFLQEVEIKVNRSVLYSTPTF